MTEPAPPQKSIEELKAELAEAERAEAAAAAIESEDPVPVADQKAAGVPPDETVTIAEQKAGAPLPEALQPDPPLAVQMREGGGTGNESPALPANITSGAARSHALLGHAQEALDAGDPERAAAVIALVQDELDRYLPDQVKAAGVHEARQLVAEQL